MGQRIDAATVVINVTTNADKASKHMGNLDKQTKSFGKTAKSIAWAAIAAAILKIGQESIKAASAAEETRNKFNVVFRDIRKDADAASKNLVENFGLSSRAAQQLLSDTGDLLTGFGFTQEEALKLSDQVNTLAVDLASFTNFAGGAEGASAALTKALLGEREAIKSLGIAIGEADIKRLAEEKGIVGELDRQTKAALTLELALQQSKNAIGDFERSSDSYANQARIAKSATEDLAAEIGRALLPAATKGVGLFGQLAANLAKTVKEANDLTDNYKEWVQLSKSVDEGTASNAENLKVLELELAEIQRRLSKGLVGGAEARSLEIQAVRIERLIEEYEELIDIEKSEQLANQLRQKQAAEAAEAEAKRLAKIAENNKILQEAYELTDQGRIEAVEANIRFFESFSKGNMMAQAVLSDLKEEYANLTQGMIEATSEVDWEYTMMIENMENKTRTTLGILGDNFEILKKNMSEGSKEIANGFVSAFSAVGDAIVQQENVFEAFGKSVLRTISKVLTGIAQEMAVRAAISLIPAPGVFNPAAAAGFAGASALAATASGVLNSIAGAQFGGEFTVNPGFAGDSALLRVNEGEKVSVDPVKDSGTTGDKKTIVQIGDREFQGFIEETMQNVLNSGRITIDRQGIVRA